MLKQKYVLSSVQICLFFKLSVFIFLDLVIDDDNDDDDDDDDDDDLIIQPYI